MCSFNVRNVNVASLWKLYNIWLWCKLSNACNTLQPITRNRSRDKTHTSSPSSSYLLTLRASLFPGNYLEVLESHVVPNVFFSFLPWLQIQWDCRSLSAETAKKHAWLAVVQGKARVFVYRVHRRQAKWAFQMWQYGTFQAQTDKKWIFTWMHIIYEHTVVQES